MQRITEHLPRLIARGITALPLFPLDGIELTYVPLGYVSLAGSGLALALRNGRRRVGGLDKFAPGMIPATDAGEPAPAAHICVARVAYSHALASRGRSAASIGPDVGNGGALQLPHDGAEQADIAGMQPRDDDTVGQGERQADFGRDRSRHGDSGKAGKRVRGRRLFELFAPVSKLVIDQCLAFAKGVAGEAGVKPGSDLLLPKSARS